MPTRSCIVCKEKKEKKDLMRVVSDKNYEAFIDEKQKVNSRAIYFCNDKKCLEKFLIMSKKGKIKINNIDIKSLEKLIQSKIV